METIFGNVLGIDSDASAWVGTYLSVAIWSGSACVEKVSGRFCRDTPYSSFETGSTPFEFLFFNMYSHDKNSGVGVEQDSRLLLIQGVPHRWHFFKGWRPFNVIDYLVTLTSKTIYLREIRWEDFGRTGRCSCAGTLWDFTLEGFWISGDLEVSGFLGILRSFYRAHWCGCCNVTIVLQAPIVIVWR